MKIALIITGRIAMYEVGLIHTLTTSNHEFDLFMSLNGENCDYYDKMKTTLSPWLKFCNIQKFELNKEFCEKIKPHNWINTTHCKYVDGYLVPYNVMSMYYNEKVAMEAATKYADTHKFEYGCYLKFRSDLMNVTFNENLKIPKEGLHLISPVPNCMFHSGGIHKAPIVCDAFAWGNRETMKIYFNTYDYVLKKTEETDGNFFISFECSLTDNLIDNGVTWEYVNIPYDHIHYDKSLPCHLNPLEKYGKVGWGKNSK